DVQPSLGRGAWRNGARRKGWGGRREARTQGAPIAVPIGATEDAAAGAAGRRAKRGVTSLSAALRHSHCFAKPSYRPIPPKIANGLAGLVSQTSSPPASTSP